MQIHQLRYFCAVARTGSFTRAAQQERLAQPSLSQQIRKLEDELGTKLFDRLGRTVRLTQLGKTFLPRAEAIIQQVATARIEIQEMAGADQGKLVIGAIPTIAPYFLPSRLASFAKTYPRSQITVVEEVTNELTNLVQQGVIDLALVALPAPVTHCQSHELFRERLYLVVPRNHRLASLHRVHLAEIERDPFLLLKDGHCFREHTLALCGRARLRPNIVFESGQFSTILAMVEAGTGVSVVPEMAIDKKRGCRFIRLADESAYRRVGILQLEQHFRSRTHHAFLTHLQKRKGSQSHVSPASGWHPIVER